MPTIPMLDTNTDANTEETDQLQGRYNQYKKGQPKKTIDESDAKQKQDARLKASRFWQTRTKGQLVFL